MCRAAARCGPRKWPTMAEVYRFQSDNGARRALQYVLTVCERLDHRVSNDKCICMFYKNLCGQAWLSAVAIEPATGHLGGVW